MEKKVPLELALSMRLDPEYAE